MQIKDMIPAISWPWSTKEKEHGQNGEGERHPIATLQRDMNRAFEGFWRGFENSMFAEGGGLTAKSDVVETDGAVEVSMELPGLEEKDLDVSVTADSLTIRGEKKVERKEEKKGFYLSERSYGAVTRTIPLPGGVDVDGAKAAFKNGVLTVTLPKSAEAKSPVKKIDVRAG